RRRGRGDGGRGARHPGRTGRRRSVCGRARGGGMRLGAMKARMAGLTRDRWGRIVLALLAGAGAALAHPPFHVLPGLLGYPLLLLLADRPEGMSGGMKGGFWVGWLAGFAYFFIGCWWVAEAFLVNPAQAWMAPFAASLLPAGMGLFWGLATLAYRRFSPA